VVKSTVGVSIGLLLCAISPSFAVLTVDYRTAILNPAQNIIDLAADSQGNLWVTGNVPFAASFTTTPGALQETWVGPVDVFVAKLDATGTIVYATYVPTVGRSIDLAGGLAVDADDNVYIVGQTVNGLATPTNDAFQFDPPGNTDTFLMKLDGDGNLLYATHIGGNGRDSAALANDDPAAGVAVDEDGNVFVVGATSSTDFPVQNAVQGTRGAGNDDAFIIKFDSGFARQWSTYFGNEFDYGKRAATDAEGNLYVLGWADQGFPTTPGALQEGGEFSRQYFVAKFSGDGMVDYATYFNGVEDTTAFPGDIGVSDDGEALFGGFVFDSDVATTPGSLYPDRPSNTQSDAFLAKLGSDGSELVFSTYLGGAFGDATTGAVGIGPDGSGCISGRTLSGDFPVTEELDPLGASFLSKVSNDGSQLLYSTRLAVDRVRSLVVDSDGAVYLAAELGTPGSVIIKISEGEPAPCTADCNQDGMVSIAELVRAVNIALGTVALDQCPSADTNGDGTVSINELIQAVNAALLGCAS